MYYVTKKIVEDKELHILHVSQENIRFSCMDYGATILSIETPDKDGVFENIVLSYKDLTSYINSGIYLNAVIGPTSGRIEKGQIVLHDEIIQLDKNIADTYNLHGGYNSFAYRQFDFEITESTDQTVITFCLFDSPEISKFPGNKNIKIIYTITSNEVLVEYIGISDQDTYLNLTQHAYFNLSGNIKTDVLHHELYINASRSMHLDQNAIPVYPVSIVGTRLDFNTLSPIIKHFEEGIYDTVQNGIDDPLLLDDIAFDVKQVLLKDPVSKRNLEVYTTYPCVVCYTHNFPDQEELLYGETGKMHLGICFEAQLIPNAINVKELQSDVLLKNETYYHKTKFKFGVEE